MRASVLIIVLLGMLQGCISPQANDTQQDPLTHDMTETLTYKNEYMGDNSNLDNLGEIRLYFAGESYEFIRTEVERWYGVELSTLLEQGTWERSVQSKLSDPEYVIQGIRNLTQQ